jgi:hypothetical protein
MIWQSSTNRLTLLELLVKGTLKRRHLQHLRRIRSGLKWFVPAFWDEFVDVNGQSGSWPEGLDLKRTPELVRRLAARAVWLEQEAIVLDPRIPIALEALLRDS